MISSGGSTAVMAIIEQLTGNHCQMRSVNAFDVGAAVDFNVVIHGAAPISLRGTVSSRTQSGPRFRYVISLETTPNDAAAITHAVAVAKARRSGLGSDVPTGNGLTRAAVRVPVDFEVTFTADDGSTHTARATNLSTGGILMNTTHELHVGASLELRFRLGSVPVSVHGRIVAHQQASPNYNVAFHDIREVVKETLARFVTDASV